MKISKFAAVAASLLLGVCVFVTGCGEPNKMGDKMGMSDPKMSDGKMPAMDMMAAKMDMMAAKMEMMADDKMAKMADDKMGKMAAKMDMMAAKMDMMAAKMDMMAPKMDMMADDKMGKDKMPGK